MGLGNGNHFFFAFLGFLTRGIWDDEGSSERLKVSPTETWENPEKERRADGALML